MKNELEICSGLIEIPRGNSREDIKSRRQIIKDFYAKWIAEHPEKQIWNPSLKANIHVKFTSINEACGHAPRSVEATIAQLHLSKILAEATLLDDWPPKYGDKNQKAFSRIYLLRWHGSRVLVGFQKATSEYVLYYISGGRIKRKAAR